MLQTEYTTVTIISAQPPKTVHTSLRFAEEAQTRELQLEELYLGDLSIQYDQEQTTFSFAGRPLEIEGRLFIPRNPYNPSRFPTRDCLPYQLLIHHLVNNGVPVLNGDNLLAHPWLEDKLWQTYLFQLSESPHINTQYSNVDLQKSTPFVAKPRMGSHGDSIRLIENDKALKKLLHHSQLSKMLIQEVIENDGDVRIITTRKQIIAAMHRHNSNKFINNFSAGGNIDSFDVPDALVATSTKLCNFLDCDYIGIDYIYSDTTAQWLIMEVNRYCQTKGIESATGVNVIGALLDLLLEKVQ